MSAAKRQSRSYCAEASDQEPVPKKCSSNDIRRFFLTGRLTRCPHVQGKIINETAGRQLHDSNIAITIRFLNYNSYIHTAMASCISLDIIIVVD